MPLREIFRVSFESAPNAIMAVDPTGRIRLVNGKLEELFGYSREELIGEDVTLLVPEGTRAAHASHVASFFRAPLRARAMGAGRELFGRRKDGREVPVEIGLNPVETLQGPLLLASIIDITERKASTSALERLGAIVEASNDAILSTDLEGRILTWNRAATRLLGYEENEAIGRSIYTLVPERERCGLEGTFSFVREGKSAPISEGFVLRRDESELPVSVSVAPIRDALGRVTTITIVARDISELAKFRAAVSQSLQEKDALFMEVHHRVKNNLQVVSSLLNLQRMLLPEGTGREVLLNCQNRVRAISLVHEKLYKTSKASRLAFGDYVHELVGPMIQAFVGEEQERIAYRVSGDGTELSLEAAISCGLIINELVTNALKHAFPEGRKGTISLTLREVDGRKTLEVADDGVGRIEGAKQPTTPTLGLDLVSSFAKQLKAETEVSSADGMKFRFSWR